MVCSDPKLSETIIGTAVKTAYCFRRAGSSASTTAGSLVLHPSSCCPLLEWCKNQNLFQHLYGLKFHCDGHTYVQPILTLSFPGASISLIIFSTAYLMLITSSP